MIISKAWPISLENLLKKHWLFIVILLAGIILRSYKALDWFAYSHDQDLAGWIVKDILVNKHIRLIGQETTSHGVFIGPLFYYLLIPFYLLTSMDPKGTVLLPIIISGFTIFSFYAIFTRIFNKEVGILASLFYSLSYFIVFVDREVVPTTPVMLWSVWFLYGINLILKGDKKAYPLIGFLGGLIWNFNLALLMLSPIVLVAQILSGKKINTKSIFIGIVILLITLSPFMAFEARHSFQQTKAIISSLSSQKDYIPGTSVGLAKLDRVMQLVDKNTTSLIWDSVLNIRQDISLYLLTFCFLALVLSKKIDRNLGIIFFLWQIIFIVFFSVNSLNPSEYYFNGMNVVWISIISLTVYHLMEKKKLAFAGPIVLVVFFTVNFIAFSHRSENKSGYLERKAITQFIADDSKAHGYPCVSVSYITSPGNDLGYRYFFYLENLHVNQPKSGSPVYTIVFPLSKVDRVDKTFGVLGLVLPDYGRYTKKSVEFSCSGENSNLTDPMFGYTE